MSNFRVNLKQELTYRDMRVKELSQLSGVSKRTIDHYLAENSSEPLAEAAVKIAQALGVTTEYLICGNDVQSLKSVKPEVASLIPELNRMSSEDFKMFENFIKKWNKKK